MRRELENSIFKAKIQIKQIGGFTIFYPNVVVFWLELLNF